jgi:hypothetical protein
MSDWALQYDCFRTELDLGDSSECSRNPVRAIRHRSAALGTLESLIQHRLPPCEIAAFNSGWRSRAKSRDDVGREQRVREAYNKFKHHFCQAGR